MKNLLIALALMTGLSAQAKTVTYDVYATDKVVESSAKVNANVFDFRIAEVTKSKTYFSRKCDTQNGPISERERTGLCSEVILSKVTVAQIVVSFKPYGTTDRFGEVNNGKRMEFVSFNVALDKLSASDLEVLENGNRRERKDLAYEIFEIEVVRDGAFHTIKLL